MQIPRHPGAETSKMPNPPDIAVEQQGHSDGRHADHGVRDAVASRDLQGYDEEPDYAPNRTTSGV